MQQTGIVIAPMGIGEVLDAGFTLARRNFRSLATTTAWGGYPAGTTVQPAGVLFPKLELPAAAPA